MTTHEEVASAELDMEEWRSFCRPRTPLFTAALLLTAVHALVLWLAGALLVAIAMGEMPEMRARLTAWHFYVLDLVLAVAPWAGGYLLAVASLQLIACAGAWFRSRAWTWTLLFLALVALPTSGPLSVIVSALTILGAAQVLDQSRPFPPAPARTAGPREISSGS